MKDLSGTLNRIPPLEEGLRDYFMDIVVVFSVSQKKILYISPSVEEITGISPRLVYREGYHDLFPEESLAVLRKNLKMITDLNLTEEDRTRGIFLEIEVYGRGRRRIWYEFAIRPFQSSPGEIMVHAIGRDIHDKKTALKALEESERRFKDLVENLKEVVFEVDEHSLITYISPNVKALTGYDPAELMGRRYGDLLKPEILADLKRDFPTQGHHTLIDQVIRFETRDHRTLYLQTNSNHILIEGEFKGIKGTLTDITRQKESEEKDRFLSTVLMGISDCVVVTDTAFRITDVNAATEKNTGYSAGELMGKTPEIFYTANEDKSRFQTVTAEIMNKQVCVREGVLRRKDGTTYISEHKITPLIGEDGEIYSYVAIIRDISSYKEREEQLAYFSYHDAMTGLYNRRYCEKASAGFDTPEKLPLAVVAVDINGLKLMNDVFGHAQGDELIRTTAAILKEACQGEDLLCRTGGDEFEIILLRTSRQRVRAFIHRIEEAARHRVVGRIQVSFAVGHALKEHYYQDLKIVRQEAENNMYINKKQHANVMQNQMIQVMLQDMNQKYYRESTHGRRVSQFSEVIGRALALDEKEIQNLKVLGEIHDIGKIKIARDILNKADLLSSEECEAMKQHPVIGYQIVRSVDEYTSLAEGILYHHERWDGRGYPKGLSGKMIPLHSRIIAIADAYEAMTSNRTYARTLSRAEALEELRVNAGRQFDPEIVTKFLGIMSG